MNINQRIRFVCVWSCLLWSMHLNDVLIFSIGGGECTVRAGGEVEPWIFASTSRMYTHIHKHLHSQFYIPVDQVYYRTVYWEESSSMLKCIIPRFNSTWLYCKVQDRSFSRLISAELTLRQWFWIVHYGYQLQVTFVDWKLDLLQLVATSCWFY